MGRGAGVNIFMRKDKICVCIKREYGLLFSFLFKLENVPIKGK